MKITKSLPREAVTVGQFLVFSFMTPPLPIFSCAANASGVIREFLIGRNPDGSAVSSKTRHTRLGIVLVFALVCLWPPDGSPNTTGQLLRAGHIGLGSLHHNLSERGQLSKSIYRLDPVGKETRVLRELFFRNLFLCCRKD